LIDCELLAFKKISKNQKSNPCHDSSQNTVGDILGGGGDILREKFTYKLHDF
jgi:hypothetical protein